MTHNVEVLNTWIDVARAFAAVSTTAVPVLYSFSRWRSRMVGQLFMYQALSFAFAIDTTLILTIWEPGDFQVHFWLKIISLVGISISTIALSIKMWRLNHPKKKNEGKHDSQSQ